MSVRNLIKNQKLQTEDCKLQTEVCKLLTEVCQLPTEVCPLKTENHTFIKHDICHKSFIVNQLHLIDVDIMKGDFPY